MKRPRSVRSMLGEWFTNGGRLLVRAWPQLTVGGFILLTCGASVVTTWTKTRLIPPPLELPPGTQPVEFPRVVDRYGEPLSITYQNRWNVHDFIAFHDLPPLLVEAMVAAEDQRFFEHSGVDWLARLHAATQNLRAGRIVRGASTITEQAVRILHPRPRTPSSRWLESFEATALERRFEKTQILELYLNQVPYARQLRGVGQAAREYFGRDLETLTPKEILALVVLVRSPSRLDLVRGTEQIERPLSILAERLHRAKILDARELAEIHTSELRISRPRPPIEASHFVRFVRADLDAATSMAPRVIRTTLDGRIQQQTQSLLDQSLTRLRDSQVETGAALVVDLETSEILAWVNAGGLDPSIDGAHIDKVTTLRQPGSALKPFVYAMAMEKGWTASTLIDDAPLADPIGNGLHQFRNYSRRYYGPLRLREALANSLNTPAVRAARFVGGQQTLLNLRSLGFESLDRHPEVYGDGLALGTGEVSLFAMARAYATLARGGVPGELSLTIESTDNDRVLDSEPIISPEVASIITDILSDPEARSLEFGRESVLALPQPTAVKTGTSNDYRDAWAVGFTSRWLVAVWMGNLDREPMLEITGSRGPALVMRSVFAELERSRPSSGLAVERSLGQRSVCRTSGRLPRATCPLTTEWFRRDHLPNTTCELHGSPEPTPSGSLHVRLESPTPGLHLAMDPRIPDRLEAFPLKLSSASNADQELDRIEWLIDDTVVATTREPTYLWHLSRGHHIARARVWTASGAVYESQNVGFLVK